MSFLYKIISVICLLTDVTCTILILYDDFSMGNWKWVSGSFSVLDYSPVASICTSQCLQLSANDFNSVAVRPIDVNGYTNIYIEYNIILQSFDSGNDHLYVKVDMNDNKWITIKDLSQTATLSPDTAYFPLNISDTHIRLRFELDVYIVSHQIVYVDDIYVYGAAITPSIPSTSNPTTSNPTTSNPTTSNPTTSNPTTSNPTTSAPTSNPTTSNPTTSNPTTRRPTTDTPFTTMHTHTSTIYSSIKLISTETNRDGEQLDNTFYNTGNTTFSEKDGKTELYNSTSMLFLVIICICFLLIISCIMVGLIITKKKNSKSNVNNTNVELNMTELSSYKQTNETIRDDGDGDGGGDNGHGFKRTASLSSEGGMVTNDNIANDEFIVEADGEIGGTDGRPIGNTVNIQQDHYENCKMSHEQLVTANGINPDEFIVVNERDTIQ